MLVDGVDVREYYVSELRERMGLVMQEPTLFNYSVKENILYGNLKASNEEIKAATEIANATNFVESDTLEHRFTDDASSLLTCMVSDEYKEQMIAKLGKEEYDR